ncbi:cytochrome P450 [Xylariaceae sp. FL1272]|nr:cytochrome P450 [Xylariaceae sp. FL1272]
MGILQAWDQTIGLGAVVGTAAALLVAYVVAGVIYSLTWHPLVGFPGPTSTAISRIPFWIACVSGTQVTWMEKLHAKYGPLVRYSPNDLSFADQDGSAWKAILEHKKGGQEFPKAREWFVTPANGIYGINSAPAHKDHRRFRKVFAPAFSDRALKQQEPIFRKYVDILMSKLSATATQSRAIDIVKMFQFTTFDIMGELTFGEPLGLLKDNKYSRWVESVFDSIRVIPIAQFIQYYPLLNYIFNLVEPKSIKDMKYNHFKHSSDRVDRRLERGSGEPDIWNLVMAAEGDLKISLEEMYCHADVFMLAGTETTGTCMAGLTYYLLMNPEKLALLTKEIRETFSTEADITMENTAGLKYLTACIHESLRLYPPVPVGVPRVVPDPGQTIAGKWVPPETRVSVHHYATYHDPSNFRDAKAFRPERWLGDPAYQNDRREVCQPFSTGPRDCIGRNMAMHEMRLILALLFFKFDLKLDHESQEWPKQKAFVLWDKKPLMCHLTMAS